MATYVLVHGGNVSTETWNRLTKGTPIHTANGRIGGRVWEMVTPYLKAKGHSTFAPTLVDEHNCNLHGYIEEISLLINENNLKDVILVGHSFGGMIITGVAAAMPEAIRCLVYLDAAIPDPGQSLFDDLASSGHDPMKGIPGLEPTMAYVDKLEFDPQRLKPLQKVFIRCTKSEFPDFVEVSLKKIEADTSNWTIFDLPTGHLSQATMPEELAQLLLGIAN